MRIIKNLLLFTPLFFFLACQGPYHKDAKRPIKIGIQDLSAAHADTDEAEEEGESIEDTPTLDNKGVGPIKTVELGDDIDQAMVDAGEETFNTFCIACHKLDGRLVGPPLRNVLNLRSPEWTMNMILDPDTMLSDDPVARELLDIYGAPMANLGLTEDEARELVEYFRTTKD